MIDSEYEAISTRINELWPSTDVATGTRALELMGAYTFDAVMQALADLRNEMPDYHRVIEPNKLAAILKKIAPAAMPKTTHHIVARTEAYLANQKQSAVLASEEMLRVEQQAERAAALRAKAVEWCEKFYDACWPSFANKEKLIKIRLSQMELERMASEAVR